VNNYSFLLTEEDIESILSNTLFPVGREWLYKTVMERISFVMTKQGLEMKINTLTLKERTTREKYIKFRSKFINRQEINKLSSARPINISNIIKIYFDSAVSNVSLPHMDLESFKNRLHSSNLNFGVPGLIFILSRLENVVQCMLIVEKETFVGESFRLSEEYSTNNIEPISNWNASVIKINQRIQICDNTINDMLHYIISLRQANTRLRPLALTLKLAIKSSLKEMKQVREYFLREKYDILSTVKTEKKRRRMKRRILKWSFDYVKWRKVSIPLKFQKISN
jgi:hypothetical protein